MTSWINYHQLHLLDQLCLTMCVKGNSLQNWIVIQVRLIPEVIMWFVKALWHTEYNGVDSNWHLKYPTQSTAYNHWTLLGISLLTLMYMLFWMENRLAWNMLRIPNCTCSKSILRPTNKYHLSIKGRTLSWIMINIVFSERGLIEFSPKYLLSNFSPLY